MAGGSQASGGSAGTATVLPPYWARQWPREGVEPTSPHIAHPRQSAWMEGYRFSTTSGSSWDLASGPAVLNPRIQLIRARK